MLGQYCRKALAALAAGAFFWALATYWPGTDNGLLHLQGSTMGTTWHVQIADEGFAQSSAAKVNAISAEQITANIQTLLDHLDREVFSTWSSGSELSQLNRSAAGQVRRVSAELFDVLTLSRDLHAASLGAFDISVGALVNLWGFGPQPAGNVPDTQAVLAATTQQGLSALVLDPAASTVTLRKPLALDLSGIAKGYATDRVAALLVSQGFGAFLVEIGGELRLQGLRPDGDPWLVAIEKPQAGAREAQARISSRGQALALAGSGDYRNFRLVDGLRYSHEIDPRSGYPVAHNLAAVTVISHSAAVADAWATALMVLGPEAGPALAEREALAAYFIMRGARGLEHRHTTAFAPFLYDE